MGFLLARFAGVQVQTVSRLTFHALAPALVFNVLVTSTLDAARVRPDGAVLPAGRGVGRP